MSALQVVCPIHARQCSLDIEVGAHSTDDNENRARSYREQVLEEHDTIQATRYRGP
jgi:hypothetical protein